MKKLTLIALVVVCAVLFLNVYKHIMSEGRLQLTFFESATNVETLCFDQSYAQVTDLMVANWDSVFLQQGIDDNAFAQFIFLIQVFTQIDANTSDRCYTLGEILLKRITNRKSSALAICAIMQRLGWDILCFYNEGEVYLGVNFDEGWMIRKGHWVDKDSKRYYLKEIDDFTPVGVIICDEPASIYKSIDTKKEKLQPVPLLQNMPICDGTQHVKILKWNYQNTDYSVQVSIPEAQIDWTRNLPSSLYGMVSSGVIEIENVGLDSQLVPLVHGLSEFEQVNLLLKFCQSESIFSYDNTQPVNSISVQLLDGRNDCDGRSVFLYALLIKVLRYEPDDIVFVTWPNHVALGVRPKTLEALVLLKDNGYHIGNGYYLLDPAYAGDTYWGSKMDRLKGDCDIIR